MSTCTTVASGSDERPVAHRPHVQGASPADDQVGATDQLGRERRGEPAGDAERPRVAVEQPVGDGARRQQRAAALGERLQRLPATSAPAAATDDEDRPIGGRQRRSEPGRTFGVRRCGGLVGRRGEAVGAGRHLRRLHIERQVEQHRAPLVARRPVGGRGISDSGARRRDSRRHGADGGGERRLVDVEVGQRVGDLGGEHEHRRAALGRLGDPRHGVGEAASLVDRQCGDGVAHPRVGIGHRRRAALVAGGDEPAAGAHEGVGDVEVARPDDAEGLLHAEAGEGAPDGVVDPRHRSTRARTRAGLPDPATIGSGAATIAAPGRRQAGTAAAVASARTSRCPSGRRGTGTPARTSGRRRRQCRRSRCRRRSPVPPRRSSGRTRPRCLGCAGPCRRRSGTLPGWRSGCPTRCGRAASRRRGAGRAGAATPRRGRSAAGSRDRRRPARRNRARPPGRSAAAPAPRRRPRRRAR